MKLEIKDESLGGDVVKIFTLENLDEEMSLGEIIKAKVYQEVQDYNQRMKDVKLRNGNGVDPSEYEKVLNTLGEKVLFKDWADESQKAFNAFRKNGFFVLVDDEQAEDLEQRFKITTTSDIRFVKMIPLVRG